jgi:hypothetical protein
MPITGLAYHEFKVSTFQGFKVSKTSLLGDFAAGL